MESKNEFNILYVDDEENNLNSFRRHSAGITTCLPLKVAKKE